MWPAVSVVRHHMRHLDFSKGRPGPLRVQGISPILRGANMCRSGAKPLGRWRRPWCVLEWLPLAGCQGASRAHRRRLGEVVPAGRKRGAVALRRGAMEDCEERWVRERPSLPAVEDRLGQLAATGPALRVDELPPTQQQPGSSTQSTG